MKKQRSKSQEGAPPRIGISRSPGGLPGLDAHVGVWQAMAHVGIEPTNLFGCSAGAAVSAIQAAGHEPDFVSDYLWALTTSDVLKKRRLWQLRACFTTYFADPEPIRNLLATFLPEAFEDLAIPLGVSATKMCKEVEYANYFFRGPKLRAAVMASMSIAGVWPYAPVTGEPHSDGGTTDAIVIPDNLADYTEFYVVNLFKRYKKRDKNVLSRMWWNFDKLQSYERDCTRHELSKRKNVRWLDIDMGNVSSLSFDHSLILSAYRQARSQLGAWFPAGPECKPKSEGTPRLAPSAPGPAGNHAPPPKEAAS